MTDETKKLLGFLPADNVWGRALRRGIVVAVLGFASILLKEWIIPGAAEVWVAVLVGILALIDKIVRDELAK